MKGFMTGMLLGIAAGAAADMALQTRKGKRTTAGRAMKAAVGAMDGAASAMQHTMGR